MINADKPHTWQSDTKASVSQYNYWFIDFAPQAYDSARAACADRIEEVLDASDDLTDISPELILDDPTRLMVLRMLCAPPLARDRLSGLSDTARGRVKTLEEGSLPTRTNALEKLRKEELPAMLTVIKKLIDPALAPWLAERRRPTADERSTFVSVIGDRVSGSLADPAIRNAQESRQLEAMDSWLNSHGYAFCDDSSIGFLDLPAGSYAHHKNVRMFKNALDDSEGFVNTPIDVVIAPKDGRPPLLFECKSAGDFTNTNKRRKEEDTKVSQLRATYNDIYDGDCKLYLFLCGYFDDTYLGYEAANHMDWVWEHRIDDLGKLGL